MFTKHKSALCARLERSLSRGSLAVVNLMSGSVEGLLSFESGIEEVFAVALLPGWRNPAVIGPDTTTDTSQTVWLVPPLTS